MAKLRVQMRTRGDSELRRLAKALADAGRGDLRKELNSGVRRAARPMVGAVRQAALSLPAETGQSTGLRAAIAAASRFSNTAAGVRVLVDNGRMPADQQTLPGHTDSGSWRHPVFGSNNWVTQHSRANWFLTACLSEADTVEREIEAAMDRVADKIEAG